LAASNIVGASVAAANAATLADPALFMKALLDKELFSSGDEAFDWCVIFGISF